MKTLSKYVPRVGDGVFHHHTVSRERGIVRGIITDTYYASQHGLPQTQAPITGVQCEKANGAFVDWPIERITQETFGQYLTRPTGMGRWRWPGTVVFLLISMVLGIAAFTQPIDEAFWRVFMRAFIPALWALVVYMHWRNYTHHTA